ncbi:hypothetical protein [Variovorax sp. RA8]|uniref:hypothetical protein n=1 Tax=Variovorax sp. (strain JCM 16519 / RA8) TaxID=662548 RepID=UPI0013172DE1|nr:hypothetical protein [Variovorax sp. RA8]VTU44185.1 hypothetical protein RA8P2_00067 [Variovorax sp. RA8]
MSRYELPAIGACYDEWRLCKSPTFAPTPRQRLVMEAAERAIDAGLFYNVEVNAAVAKDLGVTQEQLARNTQRVDGGDFAYDVYFARSAVEAIRHHRKLVATAQALAFQPGDKVGALIVNDGKRNTGMVITKVGADGIELEIEGKRAGKPIGLRTNVGAVASAIANAFDRGARKDTYDEFKLARLRHTAGALTTKVAERLALFGAHELGEADFLADLIRPDSMSKPVFQALQSMEESLDQAVARGEDCSASFNAIHGEVVRLLDAAPWTMHPDYGCVLASEVEESDRQAVAAPAG